MTTKCKPHIWQTPQEADSGITCQECGRYMDFMEDITPNLRASIVNGVERRRGREYGDTWRKAFDTAFDAAGERRGISLRPSLPTPVRSFTEMYGERKRRSVLDNFKN